MKPMDLLHTHIHLGLEKPLKLLHVSDTHISLADDRDDERKQTLAASRAKAFEKNDPGCCLAYFQESCRLAEAENALLVHTGDLFDFVSEKHCEMAHEIMPEDYFFAVGNHEFSLYVGEAFEDETYKAKSFDKIQAAFPKGNLTFASRVINGVNLIAMDNTYYDFSAEILERFKEEEQKGLPMLLFFHTPLYAPDLYQKAMAAEGCAYLVGTPIELMESYSDYRFRQQVTTPQTRRFLDHLYSCKLVKAVFAGHLHAHHEGPLENGVMQYVVDAQYRNAARMITID